MALALPPGGRVITCDVNEETTAIARRYAEEAGVADRIDYRLGPGLETIAQLDGPFDLVFIDADKPNYVNYYEATLPLLADGGLIVADNTLWSGRVVDETDDDALTDAIRAFNDHVSEDPRVANVLLTVRDGMNMGHVGGRPEVGNAGAAGNETSQRGWSLPCLATRARSASRSSGRS